MDIRSVLLNPNGRMGARNFWRGMIVLVGIQIIIAIISAYGGVLFSSLFSLLLIGLVYPYICIFGKRLHDAGLTAWLYLLAIPAWMVSATIITSLLTPLLAPGASDLQQEVAAAMEDAFRTGDIGALTEPSRDLAQKTLTVSILSIIGSNGIVGAIAAFLRPDPNPNMHGDPVRG